MRPVVMAAIAQRQMPVESDLPSANGQFACLARRSGCACACYVLRLDFAAPGIPHTQGSPHAGSLPVTAPVLPFANRGKGSGGTCCFRRLGLVGESSEERRVGKEWVCSGRFGWSPTN